MAFPATKRYSYWAQLAILTGCVSVGFLLAALLSSVPLLLKTDLKSLIGASPEELTARLFIPENAGLLRVVQFLSTLFLFFVPSIVYARICHQKAFAHLGYHHRVNYRQLAVVILIMLACLPLVGALADLTSKLPFSKATFAKFQAAEDAYNKQVAIIGRMDNFMDYILSLLMLAILPALFEETLFRGAIQNLLSRWWKAPVLAIVVTACIFSAVHGSYLGFLSRAALGFVLGWMYYRTGNLWLNIIAHAANNAVAITVLYVMRLKDPNVDLSKADPHYPMWWGIVAVAFVYGLFFLFEKVSNYQVSQPGKEILIETNDNNQPPWTHTTGTTQNA